MRKEAEQMLLELYNYTIVGKKDSAQINRADNDQWRELLRIIDYLVEKGLIKKVGAAMGFVIIKLTSYGVDFVEDELI